MHFWFTQWVSWIFRQYLWQLQYFLPLICLFFSWYYSSIVFDSCIHHLFFWSCSFFHLLKLKFRIEFSMWPTWNSEWFHLENFWHQKFYILIITCYTRARSKDDTSVVLNDYFCSKLMVNRNINYYIVF